MKPPTDARVAELRRAFDEAFSEPAAVPDRDGEAFIGIGIGGRPFALRQSDLSQISRVDAVVEVPAASPALLGLTSVRGALVVLYSLGRLLGGAPSSSTPAWMARVAGEPNLGLAFDVFEGQWRAPLRDVIDASRDASSAHVRHMLRIGRRARPLIDVASISRLIASPKTPSS